MSFNKIAYTTKVLKQKLINLSHSKVINKDDFTVFDHGSGTYTVLVMCLGIRPATFDKDVYESYYYLLIQHCGII